MSYIQALRDVSEKLLYSGVDTSKIDHCLDTIEKKYPFDKPDFKKISDVVSGFGNGLMAPYKSVYEGGKERVVLETSEGQYVYKDDKSPVSPDASIDSYGFERNELEALVSTVIFEIRKERGILAGEKSKVPGAVEDKIRSVFDDVTKVLQKTATEHMNQATAVNIGVATVANNAGNQQVLTAQLLDTSTSTEQAESIDDEISRITIELADILTESIIEILDNKIQGSAEDLILDNIETFANDLLSGDFDDIAPTLSQITGDFIKQIAPTLTEKIVPLISDIKNGLPSDIKPGVVNKIYFEPSVCDALVRAEKATAVDPIRPNTSPIYGVSYTQGSLIWSEPLVKCGGDIPTDKAASFEKYSPQVELASSIKPLSVKDLINLFNNPQIRELYRSYKETGSLSQSQLAPFMGNNNQQQAVGRPYSHTSTSTDSSASLDSEGSSTAPSTQISDTQEAQQATTRANQHSRS